VIHCVQNDLPEFRYDAPMNILVTGASGFIGQHLCQHLNSKNHNVTELVRNRNSHLPSGLVQGSAEESASDATTLSHPGESRSSTTSLNHPERSQGFPSTIAVPDISKLTPAHLQNINTVIHLAAVTHDPRASKSLYHQVNVEGTRHLANCCVEAGVKRLIFISYIKAVRERSRIPVKINIAPAPEDEYGRSKLEAERLLVDFQNLETVIVRIPLVYGRGAKGNFNSLVKLVKSGIPLPVLSIQNKRSYLGVDNLCEFLCLCTELENIRGHTFHIADGPPVSLAGLIRSMYSAMDHKRRSFWIPNVLAIAIGNLFLGPNRASKLFGDLEIDTSQTTLRTGWYPAHPMQQGLDKMFGSG